MSDLKVVNLAQPPARDPDVVLEKAKGCFEAVLVLGYSKDEGAIEAFASLNLTPAEIFFMMEQFESKLINGDYTGEN